MKAFAIKQLELEPSWAEISVMVNKNARIGYFNDVYLIALGSTAQLG